MRSLDVRAHSNPQLGIKRQGLSNFLEVPQGDGSLERCSGVAFAVAGVGEALRERASFVYPGEVGERSERVGEGVRGLEVS